MSNENNEKKAVDLSVLFNEDTSDESKAKITTMFEAAVELRAQELDEEREALIEKIVEERVADELEAFAEGFDKYTSYVAEQWMDENQLAIESALKVEMAESLMNGLAELFAAHRMNIPEADGIVEGLVAKNEELTSRLNEQIDQSVILSEKLQMREVEDRLGDICEGLTDTQSVKLKELAENVRFTTPDDFEKKVRGIRESLFKEQKNTDGAAPGSDSAPLTEDKKAPVAKTGDPTVDQII